MANRQTVNSKIDQAIFTRTAKKTKKINVEQKKWIQLSNGEWYLGEEEIKNERRNNKNDKLQRNSRKIKQNAR